jgi:hypothetical protein
MTGNSDVIDRQELPTTEELTDFEVPVRTSD